jgi:hypothetical protein
MKLAERSYSAKNFRPRPVIYSEPDGSLLIVTTSWGESDQAHRVNEDIAKYVQAALADVEVTSPFQFLTCLSDEANYLRVAALITNEALYRSDNRTQYTTGIETLILLRRESKVAYAQIGSPHLLIQRTGQGIAPLSVNYESSFELSHSLDLLPPIPNQLLGTESSLNIRCGDFRVEESDQMILYAGSFWPESLWKGSAVLDLNQITQKMVQKNPEAPFWLGIVSLQD